MLHVREGVPVPRSSLSAVALGFQLLKIIEAAPTLRLQELGDFLQRHSALRLQKERHRAHRAQLLGSKKLQYVPHPYNSILILLKP